MRGEGCSGFMFGRVALFIYLWLGLGGLRARDKAESRTKTKCQGHCWDCYGTLS